MIRETPLEMTALSPRQQRIIRELHDDLQTYRFTRTVESQLVKERMMILVTKIDRLIESEIAKSQTVDEAADEILARGDIPASSHNVHFTAQSDKKVAGEK